jgi:hypothetical protein
MTLRARWEAEWRPQALSKCFLGAGTAKYSSLRSFLALCGNAHVQRPNFRRAQGNCRGRGRQRIGKGGRIRRVGTRPALNCPGAETISRSTRLTTGKFPALKSELCLDQPKPPTDARLRTLRRNRRSLCPPRDDPPQARRKTSLRKQIKSDALETFWPRLLYKARPSLDGCYKLLSVINYINGDRAL